MICDTFLHLARKTWEQMQRNHDTEILVREDSITSLNLQELIIRHKDEIKIKDFTVHEESSITGADWEWWFVEGNKAIGFAVQAKRLEKYSYSIDYKPSNHPLQIETLLQYCSDAGDLTPLYCFYNYFPHEFVGNDQWGCAIADGYEVYSKHLMKSYALDDIQPISEPWHRMVCSFENNGIKQIERFARNLANNITLHSLALPSGTTRVTPKMYTNGLPLRVKTMLNITGKQSSLILKDKPVVFPRRLVIIERMKKKD